MYISFSGLLKIKSVRSRACGAPDGLDRVNLTMLACQQISAACLKAAFAARPCSLFPEGCCIRGHCRKQQQVLIPLAMHPAVFIAP